MLGNNSLRIRSLRVAGCDARLSQRQGRRVRRGSGTCEQQQSGVVCINSRTSPWGSTDRLRTYLVGELILRIRQAIPHDGGSRCSSLRNSAWLAHISGQKLEIYFGGEDFMRSVTGGYRCFIRRRLGARKPLFFSPQLYRIVPRSLSPDHWDS